MVEPSSFCQPDRELSEGEVVLGKYRVARKLGEGGFGRVYEAETLAGGGRVALKVGRDADDGGRMAREARLAGLLESPHAVRVFGFDCLLDGNPVIVMELLVGLSLREYLTMRGCVEPRLALEWARQLAEVLREAHAVGLFHRDLKPSNVFIAEAADGAPTIKLLDFGLARAPGTTGEHSVTDSKLVLGSPAYMSPEQIRSEGVGAVSDIWSFGVVLYEMLAGQRPFRGDNDAALLAAIVADAPMPLDSLRPSLSPELHRLVEGCLRKSPAARFGSIDEVIAALDALCVANRTRAGADAATITETGPVRTAARGQPRFALLGPVALLAVAIAGLVGWNLRTTRTEAPQISAPRDVPSAAYASDAPGEVAPPPRTPPRVAPAKSPASHATRAESSISNASPDVAFQPRSVGTAVPLPRPAPPSASSPPVEPTPTLEPPPREAALSETATPRLFIAEPDF